MTLCCSGKRRRLTVLMLALPVVLFAADAADRTKVRPVLRPSVGLRHTLELQLRDLFANPAKILEVGIRRPPKEVDKSRRELERFFKGARLTKVEVEPAPLGDERLGRFWRVTVALESLTLMGLNLAAAVFQLEGMEVDAHALADGEQLDIRKLGAIGMRFRVGQEALNAVTDNFRIGLGRGRFAVRGRKKLLILPVGYRAVGRLAFTPEGQIVFRDRSMHLNGLPLPGVFRRALRSRINPIFDLKRYLGVAAEVFRVEFLDIVHQPGVLELGARAVVLVGNAPSEQNSSIAP